MNKLREWFESMVGRVFIPAALALALTVPTHGIELYPSTTSLGTVTATGLTITGGLSVAASSISESPLFERTASGSDSTFVTTRLLATRSGSMGNGFGPALGFYNKDADAVTNQVAEISALRQNGVDNTASLLLRGASGGVLFTNLTLGWDKNSTFNVANSGYVSIQNTATPYVGQSGDVIIKAGSSLSNSAGALQLGANYIGTELPGYVLNSRYGGNGSYRQNPDMVISQYLGTTPNAGAQVRDVWETRMSFNYDRSIKFSTTGSASNNVVIDGSGQMGIGTSSPAYTLDVSGTARVNRYLTTAVALSSSGGSTATDASQGNVFTLTLSENTTLANPTNMVTGTFYTWIITQNGSAAKTLAFGNKFKWPGGVAMVVTTTLSAIDSITAYYDGTNLNAVYNQDFR